MCGITFSRENDRVSLIQTGITLTAADVPHKLMFGDIDQPESVQAELEAKFGVTRNDVLHVRSFLDHDRMFAPPIKPIDTSLQQALNDSCDATFVSNAEGFGGMLVTPAEAFYSLVEHFERWAKCLGTHGLLMLSASNLDVCSFPPLSA